MTLAYFFRRLVRRVVRQCGAVLSGDAREPVHVPTERDFSNTTALLGFTAGVCATCIAFMWILTFSGKFLCN